MNLGLLTNIVNADRRYAPEKAYWREKLDGCVDFGRSGIEMGSGNEKTGRQTFAARFAQTCRQNAGESIQEYLYRMLVLYTAALGFVLHKYHLTDECIIGMPVFEQESTGPFINDVLACRVKPDPESTCLDYIKQVRDELNESAANMNYPVASLLPDTASGRPLFGVWLAFDGIHQSYAAEHLMGSLSIRCRYKAAALHCAISFDGAESDMGVVGAFFRHVENAVMHMIRNPGGKVAGIDMLGEAERRTIETFSAGDTVILEKESIYEVFEKTVKRAPQRMAVQYGNTALTYAELSRDVALLSGCLIRRGVEPGSVVGIKLSRSHGWLVAVLAIIKAGGICLPLDPMAPPGRTSYIIEDSRAGYVLSEQYDPSLEKTNAIQINYAAINFPEDNEDNACGAAKMNDKAYIIYTSGTTGRPKGIMLGQKGIVNHIEAKIKVLGIDENDRIAHAMNMSFVASIWQLLAPLFRGACLVLYASGLCADVWSLFKAARRDKVTVMCMVPTLLAAYTQMIGRRGSGRDLPDVRWIVLTGEQCLPDLITRFYNLYPTITLLNAYGQSECSDDTCHYIIPAKKDMKCVPIGRPIQNFTAFVMDKAGRAQPVGIPGELYLSGIGLAQGYINLPQLSAQKFIAGSAAGSLRCFRTGDLVRWASDGNLEYLGRVDRQVKIRGYRIEPEEIERCIYASGLVRQVAVTSLGGAPEDQYLCAFIVSEDVTGADAKIQSYLKARLPEYMVPTKIVGLKAIPRTPNGKTDWEALRAHQTEPYADRGSTEPLTETEAMLTEIVREILKEETVGKDDDFFQMGFNSIKILYVILLLEQRGIRLSVEELQKRPTVAMLAAYIDEKDRVEAENPAPVPQTDRTDTRVTVREIEPFNDIFYKNCFYNSLFPVIRSFGLSIDPILANDLIYYAYKPDTGDMISYESFQDIIEVVGAMRINVHTQQVSRDIVSDTCAAIKAGSPVILWIDNYYNPAAKNLFNKAHHPHTILVMGYDEASQHFDVIDHTDIDALNYKKRTISYQDLRRAYDGFISAYGDRPGDTIYAFSRDKGVPPDDGETKKMFFQNLLSNSETLTRGLESLKVFAHAFASRYTDVNDLIEDENTLMKQINSVLVSRRVELYRNERLFDAFRGPCHLMQALIELWSTLRLYLIRLCQTGKEAHNTITKLNSLLDRITGLENAYVETLVLAARLELDAGRR
ncbi:MAG: amino acid adenylation domain-containing protein [Oscillospiraceae bacterium]|jgi:amino acid adenylation domain-containing protein|nr:amino acid adenylation domain-containing protein [Oscillospiraceae bacterium]